MLLGPYAARETLMAAGANQTENPDHAETIELVSIDVVGATIDMPVTE